MNGLEGVWTADLTLPLLHVLKKKEVHQFFQKRVLWRFSQIPNNGLGEWFLCVAHGMKVCDTNRLKKYNAISLKTVVLYIVTLPSPKESFPWWWGVPKLQHQTTHASLFNHYCLWHWFYFKIITSIIVLTFVSMLFRSLLIKQSQTAMKRFFTVKSYVTPSQRVKFSIHIFTTSSFSHGMKRMLQKKKKTETNIKQRQRARCES